MDMVFLLAYIVCPVIIGVGIILGKKKNNKQSLGSMYVAKGMLYFYYVVSNIVSLIKADSATRYVAGLTIGLAIIEGLIGLYDGYEKLLENAKDNYDGT